MKHAEEAQKNFDRLIGEAMARAESIIQSTRAEAEMITSGLIGRTLNELNKEHERLLAAVQNAVHKSEEIVKTARHEAEQFALQRKSDAVEQCNAVLLEAERKAGAIFEQPQGPGGLPENEVRGRWKDGGRRQKGQSEIPVSKCRRAGTPLLPWPFSKKPRLCAGLFCSSISLPGRVQRSKLLCI